MTATMTNRATWSTPEVARWLGLTGATMNRWWSRLSHTRPGSGGRIRLSRADVLTFYAWAQLGLTNDPSQARRQIRVLVAEAIQDRPAPWVIVFGPRYACTADDTETVAALMTQLPHMVMTVIGLVPAWEWTAERCQ